MDAPPPKKADPPAGLAEVERALSVLKGRHPEHERLLREDEEKRKMRSAELEAVALATRRRLRGRQLVIGLSVTVVVAAVSVIGFVVRGEVTRRARLEAAADAFRGMGFALVESSSRGEPSKLTASLPPGCLLATATSSASSRLRVTYAGGSLEGPGPVFACLCVGSEVTVTADVPAGEGLVLLRSEASAFGGSRAFPFLPFKAATIGRTDQACAEASLDAWLEGKRWSQEAVAPGKDSPSAPADAATKSAWFAADPKRALLSSAGFTVSSVLKPDAPFTIVDVPAETCVLLAVKTPDAPSLRLKGGALAIGPTAGNLGWCTSAAANVLVQGDAEHEHESERANDIVVLLAPAARIGGLFGLTELAERGGLPLAATAVAASDHGWDAKAVLLASAIPESLITVANAPDLGADAQARIVMLSVEKPNTIVSDAPDGVYSYCDPALENATGSLCVFSGQHRWRVDGSADVAAGIARARHPFWLFTLQSADDPAALKVEAQMVNLARRLRRDGFEPTTIDAVTELDRGAEVLGRAGEDAMVVVALAPAEPWAFPLTDGPAWGLDGEPRVVPIKPLERVTVTPGAKTRPLPPKAIRRSVVFRRAQPQH
jgi:hypothetical protein